MIEELNEKNEEAKDTISPATSEHSDTVEDKATDIANEKNDEQEPSVEDISVEEVIIEAPQQKKSELPVSDEPETPIVTESEATEVATSDATDNSVVEESVTVEPMADPTDTETASTETVVETPLESTTEEPKVEEPTAVEVNEEPLADPADVETTIDETVADTPPMAPATEEPKVDGSAAIEATTEEVKEEQSSDKKDKNTLGADSEEKSEKKDTIKNDPPEAEVDYGTLSKEELVEIVKAIAKDDDVVKADRVLLTIKPHFDIFRKAEREEAKNKFLADGGVEDDFEFRHDELSTRFDANYRLIKDRKSKYFQEKEKQKDTNLKKKQDLLEQIREFVDSDETNISFEKFKKFQTEWKSIGMVPNAFNKTLWANYNALMDRFYDHRSIYFELKELDRRKNLTAKLELCVKAEALANEQQLNIAIKTLNELHDEFKHLGPVPREEQEPLWQRFKAASDIVYAKRKDYVEHLKGSQDENLKKKLELVASLQAYTEYTSDRIKEWNEKTKEVLAVQKQWETIGGMPRERAKEVNKQFWAAFKMFFHNKGEFFKALDAAREGNLQAKKLLIEKAEGLKDSTDWVKTTNELIQLQKAWKESGPVPEKVRNSTYLQFKEACDFFFEQKRTQNKVDESAYVVNLEKKKAICDKIEAMAKEASNDLDAFRTLQGEFNKAGFVPKNDIGTIKSLYSDAVDMFINAIPDIDNEERQRIRLENQLTKLANDPNAEEKIFRKEQTIRKQIGKIENDISLWNNNMEFFASSKNADKVRDEFNAKIDIATKEMLNLKQQLKVLRSM